MSEDRQPPRIPPPPPPVLEYGRPERKGLFAREFSFGVLAFLASAVAAWIILVIAAPLNSFAVVWSALGTLIVGDIIWAIERHRRSGSFGFIPGFLLLPGLGALLFAVICGPYLIGWKKF